MAKEGNYPLYPYPATLNIATFVTIKLSADSSNYSVWRSQMLCLLESQELVGFIDGTLNQLEDNDYLTWKRSDSLVKGWILGSLTQQMLQNVVHSNVITARDVWLVLNQICSHKGSTVQEAETMESQEDYKYYLPLYRASLCGDWQKAKAFLKKDNQASAAQITSLLQTALHIAIGSENNKKSNFTKNLVDLMEDDALAIKDSFGETSLHYAARVGNLDTAKILVSRNSNLPHLVSNNGLYPIHLAAEYGYKCVGLVLYLFSVTKDPAPFTGFSGVELLHRLICSDLYNFATHLVRCFPDLAKYNSSHWSLLAIKPSAFDSVTQQCPCKRLSCTVNRFMSWFSKARASVHDVENAVNEALLDKSTLNSPEVEYIREKEWKKQNNSVTLVECLCDKLESSSEKEIKAIVGVPLLEAARFDNCKLVEIIVKKFPSSVYYYDENGKNILHIAVENRSERVFSLVYGMSEHRHHLMASTDSSNNTMLHLAANLSLQNKLNRSFGAALQMQQELHWFEAMKQRLPPSCYECLNDKGETAHQVFSEQHADLKAKGEKWMKNTANLCTVIAVLILTIAFAAAITFPGGKNCETGLPILSRNGFFNAFAFFNTVSLSASCISLFAFLSIITSQYAEEDFLGVFPKRLLWGILSLYASVEALMLSFGCALYFVYKENEMLFYGGFILAVLPILAFQHWRGPLINHLLVVVKRKSNSFSGVLVVKTG